MVTPARIATATQIDQSHSLGGANVHPHLIHGFGGLLSLLPPNACRSSLMVNFLIMMPMAAV